MELMPKKLKALYKVDWPAFGIVGSQKGHWIKLWLMKFMG
jgi:hypothetical protein